MTTIYRSSVNINVAAMSDDQIRRIAPSVFADDAHERMSDRYRFFSTAHILGAMRQHGFMPVRVQQTNVRDESRREFTKHMIRFRPVNATDLSVGDSLPEIVLTNAHDGTSAYKLYLGLFRLVCFNGLVTHSADLGDHKVRHSGPENLINDVIDVSFRVLDDAPRIGETVGEWARMPVTQQQAMAFASAAADLRWDEGKAPVEPQALLGMRRWGDEQTNVWTTMNRVQENLIRGGMRGRATTGRRLHTRAVNSVNEDVRLNRALWRLTEEFSKMI